MPSASRYRWAAQLAEGCDVLDAACGVGFGAHMLLAAGAAGVTGVDAFAAAIIEARERGPPGHALRDRRSARPPVRGRELRPDRLLRGDRHVNDRSACSRDERVLRPEGVLAISTPVAGAIAVHNPHHVAELAPDEFHDLLRSRFANVDLRWQHSALASVIDVGPSDGKPAAPSPPMPWTSGPDRAALCGSAAGDGELPQPAPVGSLGAGSDIGALITHAYAPRRALRSTRRDRRAARTRDACRGGLPRARAALRRRSGRGEGPARVAAA